MPGVDGLAVWRGEVEWLYLRSCFLTVNVKFRYMNWKKRYTQETKVLYIVDILPDSWIKHMSIQRAVKNNQSLDFRRGLDGWDV